MSIRQVEDFFVFFRNFIFNRKPGRNSQRAGRLNRVQTCLRSPLLALSGMIALVGAQTAHFSYAVIPLGSGFITPSSVAVDASGNIFVADSGNNAVKEILAAGGYTTVHTLANGFHNPTGVALDGKGNLFVADQGNNAVRELSVGGVNFGSVQVATSTPVSIPLIFTIDTAGTLASPVALTQGTAGLDFASSGGTCAAGGVSAGAICTVIATFTPNYAGIRYGAVELLNGSGAVIATAYLYGVGVGPQAVFQPGTQTAFNLAPAPYGLTTPSAIALAADASLDVADYAKTRYTRKRPPVAVTRRAPSTAA
jgi:hypothetical protein